MDLLFHHHRLRCLVAIDLTMDDFKPEYEGRMHVYLLYSKHPYQVPYGFS